MKKLYIQLYSVRDELEKDYVGTLKKLADMGYEGVEFAGNYGGMTPGELAEKLEFYGLTAISAHISLEQLENNFDYHAEMLRAAGCGYMVCPWSEFKTADEAAAMGKRMAALSEKCSLAGFGFGYHNHAHEFAKDENGQYLYDIMMQEAGSLTLAELDVFWLRHAGVDIEEMIRRYAGRNTLLHLKQLDDSTGEKKMNSLGHGVIDFKKVIEVAKKMGTDYFIYELDTPATSSLADAKDSIDFYNTL